MKMMRFLIPVLAVCGLAYAQDAVKLARVYKADEAESFKVEVVGNIQGTDLKATGRMDLKVSKLGEKGSAAVKVTASSVDVEIGGNTMPYDLDPFEAAWDAAGLPERLPTREAEWMFTMLAFSQLKPSAELKPGDSFEIAWTSADKSATIKGKGKLAEIAEMDGVKVAKITFEAAVAPEQGGMEAQLTGTNWIEVSGGKTFKAEGKVDVGGQMELNYKIGRVKKG